MNETALQDLFQRQIEDALGAGSVVRWTTDLGALKQHPGETKAAGQRQVLLRSDAGLGVVGLIEGIETVNRAAFEVVRTKWAALDAGGVPTVRQLAEAAARCTSEAWEAGQSDIDKTRGQRLMLVYGNRDAWQRYGKAFGNDPLVLGPHNVSGWPDGLLPVTFSIVHQEEALPFLDLPIPGWIEPERRGAAVRAAENLRRGADNAYTWVREFAVATRNGREERADFTLFVHGLPLLWVEMKTPERGLGVAAGDFLGKETYRGAPLRLLCDGRQAVLTAQTGGAMAKWHVGRGAIGHGCGMPCTADDTGVGGGQAYLLGQVLTHPRRLEFLLRRASSFNARGDFLVARPQQYQALAAWWRALLWAACSGQALDNRLIRHTQRTGKTHTMIRAIRLGLARRGRHGPAFNLAVLMVGEVTIIEQIAKAFLHENTGLMDDAVLVDEAESRRELHRLMERQARGVATQQVLLANTQKLDGQHIRDALRQGRNTENPEALVVLDESHLAQTGRFAEQRLLVLPAATHLLFTATPKARMTDYYGIERDDQILDDFGQRQALAAGLVVPVRFERVATGLRGGHARIGQIADALGATRDDVRDATALLDGVKEDDETMAQSGAREIVARLEAEMIPERLDAVADKMAQIEQALGRDAATGRAAFHPRGMVFCRDRRSAKAIIDWIQARNRAQGGRNIPDHALNLYRGLRFGLDIADFGHGDETASKYNPGIRRCEDIQSRFEDKDDDIRIDVLLAVGKYTKGYDNKQLCLVVLLRTVREASLINQIYTRPATCCEGKPSGVCLDLAFGNGNVESWRRSLELYDSESQDLPLFDEEGVHTLMMTARARLGEAAACIDPGWSVAMLGDFGRLGAAADRVLADGDCARRFVLAADEACAVVGKLPDAAVWPPLQAPLLGVRLLLGWLRPLFPELLAKAARGAGSGNVVDVFDAAGFGQRIDRALAILNSPTLKHFLDVHLLPGSRIERAEHGSHALAGARVHEHIQTAIAASRALLQAQEGEDEPGGRAAGSLGAALARALGRLIEADEGGVGGLAENTRRIEAERRLALVQREITAIQASMKGTAPATLFTQHLRAAFRRRWALLELPGGAQQRFEPLLRAAGQGWCDDFTAWRRRNGEALRGQTATAAARAWLAKQPPQAVLLGGWLLEARQHSEDSWYEDVCAWTSTQQPDRVQAAMGDDDGDHRLREQGGLLETALLATAEQMTQLEANEAWLEARREA